MDHEDLDHDSANEVPEMIDDSSQSESSESEESSSLSIAAEDEFGFEKIGTVASTKTAAGTKSILKQNPRYSSSGCGNRSSNSSNKPSFSLPKSRRIEISAVAIPTAARPERRRRLSYPSAKTETKKRVIDDRYHLSEPMMTLFQRQPRRARFDAIDPVSSTLLIPSKDCYDLSEKLAMWSSLTSLEANAIRNKMEYAYDGWTLENATEENGMYYHPETGNYIHPVHFCRTSRQERKQNYQRLELLRRRQQHFLRQSLREQQQTVG